MNQWILNVKKIIITVENLSREYAYNWWECAECLPQVLLFTIILFKWLLKKCSLAKTTLVITNSFLTCDSCSYYSFMNLLSLSCQSLWIKTKELMGSIFIAINILGQYTLACNILSHKTKPYYIHTLNKFF